MSQQLEHTQRASTNGREERAWRMAATWQETRVGGSAEASIDRAAAKLAAAVVK